MVDAEETVKNRLGFIVMDGETTLYGTMSNKGNTREVVHEFVSNRPERGGRGGQSASDVGRLRSKALRDYIQKTSELATRFFIDPETQKPNVAWLIISCAPVFKNFLAVPSVDPRLLAKILNGVDGSYPGGGPDMSNPLLAKVLNIVGVCGEQLCFDTSQLAEILSRVVFSYPGGSDLSNPLQAKVLNAVCGEEMSFDPRLQAKILNKVSDCARELMGFDPCLQAKILNVVGVSCGGEKGFDEAVVNISSLYQV